MRRILALLVTLVLIAPGWVPAARAGDKERLLFKAKPADAYPARDSHEGVTIAAEPFDTPEETKEVFGKNDPLRVGILPILVVIQNNSDRTIKLENLSIRFITRDRQNLEPTPVDVVAARVTGKTDYSRSPVPSPIPKISRAPKTKGIEVMVHAFNAPIVSAKSNASGFFYFETGRRGDWLSGATLFLNQLIWANDSQPLLYFEIDLSKALKK